MALEARLDLKLSQKLIMTPQLQLAIRLLRLSHLELTEAITQELTENPCLEETAIELEEGDAVAEKTEDAAEGESESSAEREAPGGEAGEDGAGSAAGVEGGRSDESDAPIIETRWDEYFEERASDGRDLGYMGPDRDEDLPSYDRTLANRETLTDHLLWQVRLTEASPSQREACEAVIGNLDENGYLDASVEDLVKLTGQNPEEIEAAIRVVQGFDPPGVGARTLAECLLLQLPALGLCGTLVEAVVRDHLADLERKRYDRIAKVQRTTVEAVLEAAKTLARLEPCPGRPFDHATPTYVVPDVHIVKEEDRLIILLNEDGIPALHISGFYKDLMRQKVLPPDERGYLEDRYRSAQWFIKSIQQRNRTIYRVTESILKFQRDFFDYGIRYLRPLVLRDVAEDVGMHESTISRVTATKYMSTPRGLLAFKFFFSSGLASSSGVDVSSVSVRDMIQKIIQKEPTDRPLADQSIEEILRKQGIEIARRTVAKYRGELGIPTAGRRRVRVPVPKQSSPEAGAEN
ncbi:MAG: RNA polymerase sigma-54 factor [Nitrospirae bacterium RBG_16_64_22]|nr:MAG: RNA polymerase sigma-54 factor [Nitrospirae bacterium RBG_16_64_22]